jgi:adenine deaminase
MARRPVTPRALAAARGDGPADLLVTGGRVFVPTTREWLATELAVCDGAVVGWGPREAREVVDVGGAALVAGMIDAHMHLESTKLWVDEFVRAVLPHGTTAVAADPHEIANVFGVRGVAALAEAAAGLPFTFGIAASSCVPASPFESPGAAVGPAEVQELLDAVGAIGVAEMMNYPGVVNGDPEVMAKIALAGHRRVDGHAPGLGGHQLDAYLAAGVESDHECFAIAEAREKRRKGMWVFVREGSASKNLRTLIPLVHEGGTARLCLCTDDREPDLLATEGHVNHCVRLAVEVGIALEDALVMATMHAADYHNFHHLGQLAPGFQADIVVLDRLTGLRPAAVYQRGRLVARDGQVMPGVVAPSSPPEWMRASMHLEHLPAAAELDLALPPGQARAIGVEAGSLTTAALVVDPRDPDVDLARLAVLERHRRTGRVGLGLVSGFGLRRGAFASTVAHDAHNVMVVGARDSSGPADMAAAVARLAELGGGQVAVLDGRVVAEMALPIGGLMSDRPAEEVAAAIDHLGQLTADVLGVSLPAPYMQLSFLGLSVIPHLRLTDLGLVDVDRFELTQLAVMG